jgi:hypothetical protein
MPKLDNSDLEKLADYRKIARRHQKTKPKMKISGKRVFILAKNIQDRADRTAAK